ncbi:4-galactosyl-N-acetylglucosaminide 3-alpha-L-fucosyltransferase 9-like [Clinocottus analis]|uniref:4-galactosyl-N-acetylglucosaminide 3-alpha-L-fucosyltransferase 9-like n=1 Tax=Clinocottus analis TaxID=304258 RepID=UPI0035C1E606
MSRPACPSLRVCAFGGLAALCFITIFLMYRSDVKYSNLGLVLCPAFLCAEEAQTKYTHPTNSTEPHNKHSTITSPINAEPDIIVLIWMYPFGSTFPLSCDDFNIQRCQLTDDRTLYNKSNGVLFHHRNINGELVAKIPEMPRLPFQKWVWFNMESPANTHPISEFNGAYNLTCSYRLDSDIPVPYGHLEPLTSKDESFKFPAKDKLVCWIVSNWNARYKRVQFFNELKKHIDIKTYGNAFGKHINHDDYSKIISSCKFYLSFENSIYTDYITEKLFRPMKLGTVPITLGPSRQMYEKHIPRDSFIHYEDFSTPKELAERLLYFDKNQTEYVRFFNWTNTLKVMDSSFGREHACRTCEYLQSHKEIQTVKDLKTWFWG